MRRAAGTARLLGIASKNLEIRSAQSIAINAGGAQQRETSTAEFVAQGCAGSKLYAACKVKIHKNLLSL